MTDIPVSTYATTLRARVLWEGILSDSHDLYGYYYNQLFLDFADIDNFMTTLNEKSELKVAQDTAELLPVILSTPSSPVERSHGLW